MLVRLSLFGFVFGAIVAVAVAAATKTFIRQYILIFAASCIPFNSSIPNIDE